MAVTSNLRVICLESEAFYALVDELVDRFKEKHDISQDPWISDEEAMQILRISSRSTLQRYRDEGKVRYTQPSKKVILYDRASIEQLLEENAKNTF